MDHTQKSHFFYQNMSHEILMELFILIYQSIKYSLITQNTTDSEIYYLKSRNESYRLPREKDEPEEGLPGAKAAQLEAETGNGEDGRRYAIWI